MTKGIILKLELLLIIKKSGFFKVPNINFVNQIERVYNVNQLEYYFM